MELTTRELEDIITIREGVIKMSDKKSYEEQIEDYISKLNPEMQAVAQSLRALIMAASDDLIEVFNWAMPCYEYKGIVCYLDAYETYIYLGFVRGVALEALDEDKLLSGKGKSVRHIKISSLDDIKTEAFKSLILKALALNIEG